MKHTETRKKSYERNKYCKEIYRKRKQQYTAKHRDNAQIKQKNKKYNKKLYMTNPEIRRQKQEYITKRYRDDATYKEKQIVFE